MIADWSRPDQRIDSSKQLSAALQASDGPRQFTLFLPKRTFLIVNLAGDGILKMPPLSSQRTTTTKKSTTDLLSNETIYFILFFSKDAELNLH